MTIIEITPLENGAHRNQTSDQIGPLPEGWAAVPVEMLPLENFPFGEVTVETFEDVPTVTSWTPLPMPEPDPVTEPETYSMEDVVKTMLGG